MMRIYNSIDEPARTPMALITVRAVRILSIVALFAATWNQPIRAESSLEPSHSFAFGQYAHFSVQPLPTSRPVKATLFLDINGSDLESYTGSINEGKIDYHRDLASSPLPPFAEITYWWQLDTPEAGVRETEPITFRYVDNRYNWQDLSRNGLTVHWISGDTELMTAALDVGTQAIAELDYALQPPKPEHLHIYIYPSQTELQSAMQLAGHKWAGGIAYPELNVVLIAIPVTSEAVVRMKRTIPHEMTHQMLYNRIGPYGYQNLPTWLNEGLATNFEQSPNATYALMLQESQALIPLDTLCAPFPDDAEKARLAYAQSQSVVRYLREVYGWPTLRDLLDVYADGLGCEAGVVRVLGIHLEQLEYRWTQWLIDEDTVVEPDTPAWKAQWGRVRTRAELTLASTGPWLVVVGFLLVPGALTMFLSRRK